MKHYIPVAAHRGNVDGFPENTMPAYRSAYEIGADSIELDLHMTKDGEIVLIHDDTLDRTTDLSGKICNMTLAEIQKADAGIKVDPQFAGTRVPTFREFLELVRTMDAAGHTDMTFNFELKDYFHVVGEAWAKESCDKSIAMIEEYGLTDRCYINSFDGKVLGYVQEKWNGRYRLHGYYPYSILGDSYPKEMFCVCVFDDSLDENGNKIPVGAKAVFDKIKAEGYETWIGAGVRSVEHVRIACERGGDLFTSNEPAKLMAILADLGYRQK